LLVSELTGFVANKAMKTAGKRKPKFLRHYAQQPSTWRGRSEQILLNEVGCESRKIPAAGGFFFLTFPFIALATPAGWLYEPETPAETDSELPGR
jgi:hypothetical protein